MKISNISFGLKKVFFQLLCILNLYSSIIASSAAEPPTLLEGYEITHRNDLFDMLAPKDNEHFTESNWKKLENTNFEITLKKIRDDSLVVVDAQVYKEEFLKQFTKEDLIDESNAISIFYPCKITPKNNASDLHNKYVLLFEYPRDYILPSEVMLDAEPDQIVKRNIKGHNYRPQYNSHKVRITSAEPYFFKMVKPHQTVERKLSQYLYHESDVDSKLYRDCAYYNFYPVGDDSQIKRKFEVTKVAFKNVVPTEKLLVKSDKKYWLGAVITETMVPMEEKNANEHLEEKNANKHYADFVLKTPFEVSEDDVKKMVGSLPSDRENYNYLKLFYTQEQQYKIECYPRGSTNCEVVEGVLESPNFLSTVTLDLGNDARDTWKSYVDGFPILNEALRKKFSNPNDSNMIAMMTHALNQNTTIREVRILTNCLTPSMYRTFRSWDSGSRKVTIWPKIGAFEIFSSNEGNVLSMMSRGMENFTETLTKYLKGLPSSDFKELEESYQSLLILQDYGLGSCIPSAFANIYSKVAEICYEGINLSYEKDCYSIRFYQKYDEWKKDNIFCQVAEEYSLEILNCRPNHNFCNTTTIGPSLSDILGTSHEIGEISSENILQAIFYENEAYKLLEQTSKEKQKNKDKMALYSQESHSIKFQLNKLTIIRKDGIIPEILNSAPFGGAVLATALGTVAGGVIGGPLGGFFGLKTGIYTGAVLLKKFYALTHAAAPLFGIEGFKEAENKINTNIQQAIKTMVGESK